MRESDPILAANREEMSETERTLFLKDLTRVVDEYFECDDDCALEITKTENGLLVCVLITARRIKSLKAVIG